MNEITYDKFGHCVFCHKCMIIEEIIDGKMQTRFIPEYNEEQVLLDDGSKMRVAMCINCKNNYTEKDYNKIMQSVADGWEKELEVSKWTDEKKQNYRDKYYKLQLVTTTYKKSDDELKKELKIFKKKGKVK